MYVANSRLTCSVNASQAKLNLRHTNHRYTSANLQIRYGYPLSFQTFRGGLKDEIKAYSGQETIDNKGECHFYTQH